MSAHTKNVTHAKYTRDVVHDRSYFSFTAYHREMLFIVCPIGDIAYGIS